MKKAKLIFAFAAFLVLNIYCVKSNETQTKKTDAATLAVDGGCSICYADSSGVFTPSISVGNINTATALKAHFIKVGNEVFVTGRVSWSSGSSSQGANGFITVHTPIQTTFDRTNTFGTFVYAQSGSSNPPISGIVSNNADGTLTMQFRLAGTTSGIVVYQYSYTIQPVQ